MNYVETQKEFNKIERPLEEDGYTQYAIKRAAMLAKSLHGKTGRILDAGCRHGHVVEWLCQHTDMDVVGVDIVPEFIETAINERMDGDYEEQDLHKLDFEDGDFDWVFCSHTIEHCHSIPQAVREVYRVAKVGVFWVVPLEDDEARKGNPSHWYNTLDPMDWLRTLAEPGWTLTLAHVNPESADLVVIFQRLQLASTTTRA